MLFLTDTQIRYLDDAVYFNYIRSTVGYISLSSARICVYVGGDVCIKRFKNRQILRFPVLWLLVDTGAVQIVYDEVRNRPQSRQ